MSGFHNDPYNLDYSTAVGVCCFFELLMGIVIGCILGIIIMGDETSKLRKNIQKAVKRNARR